MDEQEVKKPKIRSYWKWHPAKKKDDGTPLKKRWRKKWEGQLVEVSVDVEIGTILNYTTFWKLAITHPDNIADWVKAWEALTVPQACREYWIHPNTFYNHLSRFPHIKEKYEMIKEEKRTFLRDVAEDNISNVLTWNTKLWEKEILETSKWMLEKTSKTYNPKQEIETKSIWITLHKNSEDILLDLSKILWLSQQNTEQTNDGLE